MKEFVIGPNDAGQRLDKFVQKAAKNLPLSMVYKSIRLKRVKINGKRGQISQRLTQGDAVQLYLNDEFFAQADHGFLAAPPRVDILYEDENVLIADKKPGLLVHEDEGGESDTLIARIQHYLYDKGEYRPEREHSFAPALCNRIDRNTGGIVLCAKTAEALRILDEKIRAREVDKQYLCICHGRFEKHDDTCTAYLRRDERQKRVYVHAQREPGDVEIRTRYTVLAERGPLSLVEVGLLTGRTHQIRAHLAFLGHPLLGDGKYGSNALNRPYGMKAQALYAYRLTFRFETDAGALEYLNGRRFEVKPIWFEDTFFAGGFDHPTGGAPEWEAPPHGGARFGRGKEPPRNGRNQTASRGDPDVFPRGGRGQKPRHGEHGGKPPQNGWNDRPGRGASGGKPNRNGGQPNRYGEKPNHNGSQPNRYGEKPNHNGGQPNRYGEKPNRSGGQPNRYGEKPNRSGGQPNRYGEKPNRYGEKPNRYGGQPNRYGEKPNRSGGQPNRRGGKPGRAR